MTTSIPRDQPDRLFVYRADSGGATTLPSASLGYRSGWRRMSPSSLLKNVTWQRTESPNRRSRPRSTCVARSADRGTSVTGGVLRPTATSCSSGNCREASADTLSAHRELRAYSPRIHRETMGDVTRFEDVTRMPGVNVSAGVGDHVTLT